MNFMRFIAEELREYMARFGVRTLDELVGRTDLLKVKEVATSERAATLNLEQILDNPYEGTKTPMTFNPKKSSTLNWRKLWMKKFWSENCSRR